MSVDDPVKAVLNQLSGDQLNALRAALGGSGSSAPQLTQDQIRPLKAEADQYRRAQKQVAEAAGVLWNARLDMAIAMGSPDEVRRAMSVKHDVQMYDNCDCGGTSTACW